MSGILQSAIWYSLGVTVWRRPIFTLAPVQWYSLCMLLCLESVEKIKACYKCACGDNVILYLFYCLVSMGNLVLKEVSFG